jgi:hypothetical protein
MHWDCLLGPGSRPLPTLPLLPLSLFSLPTSPHPVMKLPARRPPSTHLPCRRGLPQPRLHPLLHLLPVHAQLRVSQQALELQALGLVYSG